MYINAKYVSTYICQKKTQNTKYKKQRATQEKRCCAIDFPHPSAHRPWLIGQPPQTLAMESSSDVAGIILGRGPCEPIPAWALDDNHAEIRATMDSRAFSVLDRCFNSPTFNMLRKY